MQHARTASIPSTTHLRTQYAFEHATMCITLTWCLRIHTHEQEETANAYIVHLYTFGCDAVASNVQHTLTGTYTLYTANGIAITSIVLLISFSPREKKPHEAPIYSQFLFLYILKLIHSISFHSESPQKCNCVHRFMFARNTETGYFNLTVTRNDEWIYCEHLHSHVSFAKLIMLTRHSFIGVRRMKIETFFFRTTHQSLKAIEFRNYFSNQSTGC